VVVVMLGAILGACGQAAAPSASPFVAPTPRVTPDPHLAAPVTADQVFQAIAGAHLQVYANNATAGPGPIVKRINADLNGWPLRITAYSSLATSRDAAPWKPGATPGRGEAPYTLAALNIILEYGPKLEGSAPVAPDPAHQAVATSIIGVLDPLLWPIEQHSVTAVPARTAGPVASSAAPSKTPKASSPRPSAAP
jgi:hypothetical protein